MKECPHCSKPVIEEAVKCRHCGGWLKSYPEMLKDEFAESAPDYFPLIIGIPLLLILHFISGYLQTPASVIGSCLSEDIEAGHLKLGYGTAITLIYAILLPLMSASISLLFKKLRTAASFTQFVFWSMIITLVLNFTIGFIFVPRALQQRNYEDNLNKSMYNERP